MEPSPSPQLHTGAGFLRRWLSAPPASSGEAAIVTVASGKGGTGKSFFATSLAILLHESGHRTTLVDCDFGLGSDHLLLGTSPRWTLQHVLLGEAAIEQVQVKTAFGPRLVAAGSGISGMADMSERELRVVARGFGHLAASEETLVFDCAAGIAPQSLLTMLVADAVVLVTNPEIAALTDAYALVKCIARFPAPPPVHVVVNRVTPAASGPAIFAKLEQVSRRYSGLPIHYLGEIPDEPAVTQRRLGQPPLVASHPECDAVRGMRRILEALTNASGGLRQRLVPAGLGLADRFLSRLAPLRRG